MPITAADMESVEAIAQLIDHTRLAPTATGDEIKILCDEAVEYGFATVCVAPCHVPLAVNCLYGSAVRVGTVVGFPCGYNSLRHKVLETADLVGAGADEIDMVIALAPLLEGNTEAVREEIAQVVLASRQAPVKVIIECGYLSDAQKVAATQAVIEGGAAFVKTSTGFGPSGASVEDVRLLRGIAGTSIGVKASGGIRSAEACRDLIAAGATRIGTSAGVVIVNQWHRFTTVC